MAWIIQTSVGQSQWASKFEPCPNAAALRIDSASERLYIYSDHHIASSLRLQYSEELSLPWKCKDNRRLTADSQPHILVSRPTKAFWRTGWGWVWHSSYTPMAVAFAGQGGLGKIPVALPGRQRSLPLLQDYEWSKRDLCLHWLQQDLETSWRWIPYLLEPENANDEIW